MRSGFSESKRATCQQQPNHHRDHYDFMLIFLSVTVHHDVEILSSYTQQLIHGTHSCRLIIFFSLHGQALGKDIAAFLDDQLGIHTSFFSASTL